MCVVHTYTFVPQLIQHELERLIALGTEFEMPGIAELTHRSLPKNPGASLVTGQVERGGMFGDFDQPLLALAFLVKVSRASKIAATTFQCAITTARPADYHEWTYSFGSNLDLRGTLTMTYETDGKSATGKLVLKRAEISELWDAQRSILERYERDRQTTIKGLVDHLAKKRSMVQT